MMEKFRNLSNNIFFKIFLGFLGLTFVMFGISGFILGNQNSWVAKIGSKTISYDTFISNLQNSKEAIYRVNNSPEVLKYLESEQFKQDLLGRMITKSLIQSLQSEFKIYPDKDLILAEIVANDSLKGKDGKFDRALYQNFLKSNNLTEKQHIDDLADEIVGAMIVQSFAEVPSTNNNLAKDLFTHRFQTRTADLITVSTRNISNVEMPNEFELNAFFEKNKDNFALPEMRKVSFVKFGVKDLQEKIVVTDEEIAKEYKENEAEYQIPESRDFYHILLSDENEAKEFLQSLTEDKDTAEAFTRLAASKGKDKSTILLNKIIKKDLPKEIASDVFALEKNQASNVLKSSLGFHIFYLVDSHPASQMPLDKVKNQIKEKITTAKEEGQIQNQMQAINDEILATGSLEKVAEKFGFDVNRSVAKFNSKGLDSRKNPVLDVNDLDDFIKNSFSLEKDRVSKVFVSKSSNQYYIICVDDIEPARQRSLDEVQVLATDMWIKDKRQQKLENLAQDISNKINDNGGNASTIIAKNNLKVETKRQLPRFYMLDAGNGRKVPYADQLLTDIFSVKVNQATKPHQSKDGEMVIAVVRSVQNPALNDKAVKMIAQEMQNSFRNDVLTEFNQYIQKQFPVEINQKIMGTSKN